MKSSFLLLLFLSSFLLGCNKRVNDFSKITFDKIGNKVWCYQKIKSLNKQVVFGYAEIGLKENDRLVLSDDTEIVFRMGKIFVNGEELDLNIYNHCIFHNGVIKRNCALFFH